MHRYMKEIYRAHENGMPVVGPTYLARAIGVSKSTAHHMLKNMERMGYGRYIERKGFVLNERGMEEARKIMRKHRLLESFLATIFSLSPEKACMEADKIDAYAGDELIEMIEEKYNYECCPCGNEIPK
ncbi:MAG: metal-dependent transcriptional regulator [Thermoplasmata archaeon]|nr:metal-dependent transcriptional regulator [Thermoplasmata archaeon]